MSRDLPKESGQAPSQFAWLVSLLFPCSGFMSKYGTHPHRCCLLYGDLVGSLDFNFLGNSELSIGLTKKETFCRGVSRNHVGPSLFHPGEDCKSYMFWSIAICSDKFGEAHRTKATRD